MTEDSTLGDALTLERRDDGPRPLVLVQGEMDAFTSVGVRSAIVDDCTGDVDVDLSSVTFMDSSGLGTLIVVHQLLEAAGRQLLIVGRSPIVERLFELSGVTTRFNLVDPPA